MDITAAELIEALKATGRRAHLANDTEFVGVEVWDADISERNPATTVWMPTQNENERTYIWGDSFQYGADVGVAVDELVRKIIETLKEN